MNPPVVDRATYQARVDALRIEEKAHTRAGDALAAERRRLPMVEVDAATPLQGEHGPTTLLDAFEGRHILIAYFHMWHHGHPHEDQCEGCTHFTSQVSELSYFHALDVTYAVLCQGPYEESRKYRDFMGWTMPWYSAEQSVPQLFAGRQEGLFHLICYLRDGDRVYETYWTTGRGVEPMAYSLGLLDLTVHGRQETWEDSPAGWPQPMVVGDTSWRVDGRPTSQWSRLR